MSSIREERQSESDVHRGTMKTYESALKLLYEITSTSRGPAGKTKMLQNQTGGNLTVTSSSKRLLSSLSIRKPIIQLLVSAAQGHLGAYSDGGLFLVSLASDIILKSVDSGKNLRLLSEIYETLLTYSVACLKSEDFSYKFSASVSDINFMSSFVKSILGSKPLCALKGDDMKYISRLLLECFLNGVAEEERNASTSENVFIFCDEGYNIVESQIYPGIIIQAPELSKFREAELNLVKRENNKHNQIKVALVTVSMSGDMEELGDVSYEVDSGIDTDELVVGELSKFCDGLIAAGIGLVLCQKVVHPQLKLRLREAGVLVVDRLGIHPVRYVARLTSAIPIQCLETTIASLSFGWIDDARHSITHDKSYLHLTRADNPISTLMLCHQQEQSLQELKDVCTTALDSLDQLLYSPYVLMGGGCWQVGLASHLTHKVQQNKTSLLQDLECSETTLDDACQIFTQSLQRASLNPHRHHAVNNGNGHVYLDNKGGNSKCLADENDLDKFCCCKLEMALSEDTYTELRFRKNRNMLGMVPIIPNRRNGMSLSECLKSREIIMDSLSMSVNAVQTAVLTACSVLNIGQVLENVC